jgi:sugar phosphate isomerase/epimerase
MRLLLTKSKWECASLDVAEFCARSAAEGYDGVEVYFPAERESCAALARIAADHGLVFIAQLATQGATPAEHLASLERLYDEAAAARPLFVSSHTGKDWFSFADSHRIFARALELERAGGVPLHHETHRGRALFNLPATSAHLRALPGLTLTADFSHFTCVHESDLADQPEALADAIRATRHAHARVGFPEGPQVPDPASPHFAEWLEVFTQFWRRMVEARRAAGAAYFSLTPEAGPPGYMWIDPTSGEPLRDAWAINAWMRAYLKTTLGPGAI